jgi:hypothetical protein
LGPDLASCGGRELVASRSHVWGERSRRGEEPRRLPQRFAPLQAPFTRARRLGGILRAVSAVAGLPRLDAGPNRTRRGPRAGALVRDEYPRDIGHPREPLAATLRRRLLVPTARHEHSQHVAVVIYRPPPGVTFGVAGAQDCIAVPCVTEPWASATARVGRHLTTCPTPLADGLIRDEGAAGEQQLVHVPGAQAETAVAPDGMADARRRQPLLCVGVGRWGGGQGRAIA